eukprot:Sspe_Gene.20393::Locus_7478_Transcript_1_3_Confidence_0.333_Length_1925::g.20393::m.20393
MEGVAPRYLDPVSPCRSRGSRSQSVPGRSRQAGLEDTDLEETECTFHPSITNYTPRATQQYLSTNAFERLASHGKQVGSRVRHSHRWSDDIHDPKSPQQKKSMGKQDIDRFLSRLQEHEERRLERLEHLRVTDPSNVSRNAPAINPKSRELIESRGNPDFFYRMQTDEMKRALKDRDHQLMKEATLSASEDEACFRPQITKQARRLRPRTVDELCNGDLARKQERKRRGAMERWQEEAASCPFTPRTNKRGDAARIQSKVSVKSNMQGYEQWEKNRKVQRSLRLETERKKQLEKEVSECTFKPMIHSAPGYISTIAASVTLAKSPSARGKPAPTGHTFGYQ